MSVMLSRFQEYHVHVAPLCLDIFELDLLHFVIVDFVPLIPYLAHGNAMACGQCTSVHQYSINVEHYSTTSWRFQCVCLIELDISMHLVEVNIAIPIPSSRLSKSANLDYQCFW
jgi:hypothetical protein